LETQFLTNQFFTTTILTWPNMYFVPICWIWICFNLFNDQPIYICWWMQQKWIIIITLCLYWLCVFFKAHSDFDKILFFLDYW